jgi:hydroxymethylglutaryl-CoA lyase
MLHGMGIETGLDLDKLVDAAKLAEKIMGRTLPGKVHLAGPTTVRR